MPTSLDDFLDQELPLEATSGSGGGIFSAASQAERTVKKDYRAAYIYINVTSYSQRQVLHSCAREFQIYKSSTGDTGAESVAVPNIHFVFGHSVGAGIQTYLITRNKQQSLFASLLAWNADLDLEYPKKGKSSVFAYLAVEKFIVWWEANLADTWEIASFRGRPATELTFFLDTENGFYHAGHIDAVLRNKTTGKYMVLEIKTTSIRNVDEAQYGNSEQPLGYSLVLDRVVEEHNKDDPSAAASFEVLYLVYSTTRRELVPLPFTKNRADRIEWLQDLLVDHTLINTYKNLHYFPQRGDSCWSFGGRCSYYGICGLGAYKDTSRFKLFDRKTMPLPEPVDFEFTLTQLTEAALRGRTVTDGTATIIANTAANATNQKQ